MRRRCDCGGFLVKTFDGSKCIACGRLYLESGRVICPRCVEKDCGACESWYGGICDHECLLEGYYGSSEGFITDVDW